MKTVLALGAHFDDVEIGLGGTLIKHRKAGDRIVIAVIHANDVRAGMVRDRVLEQKESATVLGAEVKAYYDSWSMEDIVEDLDIINPDILYFPYPQDYHQHHKYVSEIGFAVARKTPITVLMYLVTSSHSYYPNYFSIIDIEKKKELMNLFKSQMTRQPKFMEIMETQNRFFGSLIPGDGNYAEGFILHRMVEQ